jgi:hypothetical protein
MPEESDTPESPKRPQSDLIIPPTMMKRGASGPRKREEARQPKPVGLWAYLFLVVATLLAFGPTLQSELLWSEYDAVERTPYESMNDWTEAWSGEAIRRENPIALSTYFIESRLPLPTATAHRLINLFFHLLASLFLLKILESLKLRGAYAAALIFALHPAALQPLFWPGYRHELVGLGFILASLFFAVRHRDARDFVLALLLALISTLLHPAAVALPFLLALCLLFRNRTIHLHQFNRVLPFFCIALFVGVWTHAGQSNASGSDDIDALTRAGQNLYFYLRQTFFPLDLKLFHPFAERESYNVGAANNLLAFLVFVPFYVLIAFNFHKRWARGFFLGLTGFIFLLLYGLTQTGRFIDGSLAKEEHALYVALPAAVALVVCGMAGFFESKKNFGKNLWYAFFTLFLLVQTTLTASYSFAVSQTPQMWQGIAEQWQQSWHPKAALVDAVRSTESDLLSQSEMIDTLVEILEANPERHHERILLARTYRESGQNTNALREYKRILRETQPDDSFLEEAADFFDSLNLSWEARNTRERMTQADTPQ